MVLPCLPGLITHPGLFLLFASVGLCHGAVVALRKNKAPFSFLTWCYDENGILVSSSQTVAQDTGLEKQEFRIRRSLDEPVMWSDNGRSEFRVECDTLKKQIKMKQKPEPKQATCFVNTRRRKLMSTVNGKFYG